MTDWLTGSDLQQELRDFSGAAAAPRGFETAFAVLSAEQSGDKCQIKLATATKVLEASQMLCQNLPAPHSVHWGRILEGKLSLVRNVSKAGVESETYKIVSKTSGKPRVY